MSATLCADLYRDYFGSDGVPIFVGARRFPVAEFYCDELAEGRGVRLSDGRRVRVDASKARRLVEACVSSDGSSVIAPGARLPGLQQALAVEILRQLAKDGGSALVFVSGMADIEELTDALDSVTVGGGGGMGTRMVVIAIHSDIPFEEQLAGWRMDAAVSTIIYRAKSVGPRWRPRRGHD